MDNKQEQLDQLQNRLEKLLQRHDAFFLEIQQLRKEIFLLKETATAENKIVVEEKPMVEKPVEQQFTFSSDPVIPIPQEKSEDVPLQSAPFEKVRKPRTTSSLEKFVGENLINKIGILITIIGVAIGAKYSIENELISPLTRIILGYISGAALLGIGMKLKAKYLNYSAVLVSGAIAIMYFITYFAYSFYGLIPNLVAFALMFVFTIFTVFAALKYDKQIIAHIGLFGAYAVPILLSDGSGKVEILFSYMAIINFGILVLSFKKYWKSLFYAAFGLTWIIVIGWYIDSFDPKIHFNLASTFISIFFATFYVCFLAYKILKKEQFSFSNIVILLLNSFIFYGLGYALISNLKNGDELLGLFTLANAFIHFVVSFFIYKRKLADKNLIYLLSGLVLVFITIAIPVQLDGNWVTLLWVGQATLLFWIGRTKNVPIYEKLSYIMMILAIISLLQDWEAFYAVFFYEKLAIIPPIFNIMFFTSMIFIACFGFIYYLLKNNKYQSALEDAPNFLGIINNGIPTILIGLTYFAFRNEISFYWEQLYQNSFIETKGNTNYNYYLTSFQNIWLINYTLFFLSVLAFVNFHKIKSNILGNINRAFLLLFILVFMVQGLYEISELRAAYLITENNQLYNSSIFYIGIRYVSVLFLALAIFVLYQYNRMDFMLQKFPKIWDCLLHICIIWFASSELIHWLDFGGYADVYKHGLSILWGVYALFIISLGIWKKKQYFRIGGMALFAITLIKLFFYDISNLNTITKTILFVALGILLLIISFLYNKYKHLIFDEKED